MTRAKGNVVRTIRKHPPNYVAKVLAHRPPKQPSSRLVALANRLLWPTKPR